jgi:hypothetical protein
MTDEEQLRSFGYEQQLNRSMGLLSCLSISISCICITARIFTRFAYSLGLVAQVGSVPMEDAPDEAPRRRPSSQHSECP